MSNLYRVGVKADKKNSLPEKVIIPTRQGKVIAIADEGFLNCKTIKEIVLPEKTKFMGANAFSGCDNLDTISIQKTKKEIQTLNWPENWNNNIEVIYKPAVKYLVSVNSSYSSVTGLNENRLYEEKDMVTFKVEVNSGYELISVAYNGITLTANAEDEYSFTMPAKKVTITVNVQKKTTPTIEFEGYYGRINSTDGSVQLVKDKIPSTSFKVGEDTLSGYSFTVKNFKNEETWCLYLNKPLKECYSNGISGLEKDNSWVEDKTLPEKEGYDYTYSWKPTITGTNKTYYFIV